MTYHSFRGSMIGYNIANLPTCSALSHRKPTQICSRPLQISSSPPNPAQPAQIHPNLHNSAQNTLCIKMLCNYVT